MTEHNYDSYCGIYCGACDIRMAYKTGHKERLASFWSVPTVKAFLRARGITLGANERIELKCEGCRSDSLFINCKNCKVRRCAIDKKMSHCIDCKDFPCEMYKELKSVAGLLPHMKVIQGNMERIDKGGVDQWLVDQEKQWSCPECGTGFAWYSIRCRACGRDLSDRSFKLSFIQSAILKLGIRLSSLRRGK